MSMRAKKTRPDACRQRRETVPRRTENDHTTVTIYELNRMVDAWDAKNRNAERKRGCGIPNIVRAQGGTWLACMATLIGERVHAVKVAGQPRPAVKYRGLWFVNFEKEARA